MDYRQAGVDIKKENASISTMVSALQKTFAERKGKLGEVIDLGDYFANLIDIGNGKALAMSTDGAGSKVIIAELLDDYTTVGIDMVAMNVNDIICTGAEPIALVDYYAVEEINERRSLEIAQGVARGSIEAGVAVIGGETASLPDTIKGAKPKTGFDIAGTAIGIVDKDKIIDGKKVKPGDAILGLASSGIHSNGLTLARKVLDLSDKKTLRELLTPTRIYVKPILKLLKSCEVHGLAHITGGGLNKIRRLNKNYGVDIPSPRKPQKIFQEIQKKAGISEAEMYRTFNMGTGFAVVLPESEVASAKKLLSALDPMVIGSVIREKAIYLRGEKA
ncbi:MAG: phosphoribosylformylglycinamidine cyclo-ligase [archaeon]